MPICSAVLLDIESFRLSPELAGCSMLRYGKCTAGHTSGFGCFLSVWQVGKELDRRFGLSRAGSDLG